MGMEVAAMPPVARTVLRPGAWKSRFMACWLLGAENTLRRGAGLARRARPGNHRWRIWAFHAAPFAR